MLKRLSINNLAIIENIDITFKNGFTVLTGGTGAGKSLVIDSLSLLLGERAASELIRTGEEKAIIKGEFEISNSRLEALLSNLEIPFIDHQVIVERIISKSKSIVKVNDKIISLTDLNKITVYLADIHNQFDVIKILNHDNYLSIIDGFSYDMTSSYKNDYQSLLNEYHNCKKEYETLLEQKKHIEESKDYYEYELKELKAFGLKEGEKEEIEQEISLLSNYDKIYSLTQEANEVIHSDFNDKLYQLTEILSSLGKYQNQYEEAKDKLKDHYFEIDDMLTELAKSFDKMDYDPVRLNELQSRSNDLNQLEKKYKKSVPELIEYVKELESFVGEDNSIDETIQNKKDQLNELFEKAFSKGKELTLVRNKLASSIEKELKRNLSDLLLRSEFTIRFNEVNKNDGDIIFKESGLDEVDFLIETNVGEGLKPLDKIISGGEASRIILAFKTVFIKANKISTVIFDEIDTGVSGEAAEAVAKKIYEISLSSQVIAISHLPQVASLSEHHILISKKVKNDRTFTDMKELNLEEKIKEVAHLISSGDITEKQLEYAKEMVLRNR